MAAAGGKKGIPAETGMAVLREHCQSGGSSAGKGRESSAWICESMLLSDNWMLDRTAMMSFTLFVALPLAFLLGGAG